MRTVLCVVAAVLLCFAVSAQAQCAGTEFFDGQQCGGFDYIPLNASVCYQGAIFVQTESISANFTSTKTVCSSTGCVWAAYSDGACAKLGFNTTFPADCSCAEIKSTWLIELVGIRVYSADGNTDGSNAHLLGSRPRVAHYLKPVDEVHHL